MLRAGYAGEVRIRQNSRSQPLVIQYSSTREWIEGDIVAMPKILIADDNHQNAELLEAHLEGTGYETRIAVNGEDTLKAVGEWQPDVILLDVMMPKLSGFEVCQRLRKEAGGMRVGVLMVTALDEPSDIGKAVDAGTDDFLTKPINKTELLIRVRALLQSQSEPSEVDRALAYIGCVQQGL